MYQGFAGMVTAVAAWSIWGSEMFPSEKEPTGGICSLGYSFYQESH